MSSLSKLFYSELLKKTDIQFEQSPVFEFQKKKGKNWNYDICLTPITKNVGVIFGINFGGGNDSFEYKRPHYMPSGKGITNHHFIKSSKPLLKQYLKLDFKLKNFNCSNLCFFRTPEEKILTIKDYELSLGLFEEYIRFINPPWLFSIGVKNVEILEKMGILKNLKTHYDNQRKFKGYSGEIWEWHVYFVPHPMARIKNESRTTIWKKVHNELNKTLANTE